jgi:pimeloyl-ACP methyl ester carboxylesterase
MLAGDLFALTQGIGINLEEALVVGQSMGGFVALELALERRSALAGLVLVSTAPKGSADALGMSTRAQKVLLRPSATRAGAIRNIIDISIGDAAKQNAQSNVRRFSEMLEESFATGTGYTGQMAAVAAFDVRHRLKEINCPCQIVHGTADEWINLSRAEAMAEAIPDSVLTALPEVGHFPQIEAPNEMVRIIRTAKTARVGPG